MKPKLNGFLEDEPRSTSGAGEGNNVLLLEDSSEVSHAGSCLERFFGDDVVPNQVIHIAYEQSPDDIVQAWREVANGAAVPDLGIIPVNEATRSAAAVQPDGSGVPPAFEAEPSESTEWPAVNPVSDPDDILAIGGNLKQFLDQFSGAGTPTAICFDSLTATLEHTDVETLFRFLHIVTRQIEREGARAHFHLDTAAVDRSTVSTYAVLFDEVVWAGETRGQSFEAGAPTQPAAAEDATATELPPESEEVMDDSTSTTDLLLRTEPWLWVIAIATFGVGDIFTSVIGLQSGMAVEASPVAAQVLEAHGVGFIYVVKIAMFGMFYLLWKVIPRPHRVGVPMGLGGLGLFITAWNLWILSLATF